MAIIYIKNLHIETIVGIYEWERTQKQTIRVNLELMSNIKAAANSESISDALNYEEISQCVSEFIIAGEFQLIETMADKTADMILSKFNTTGLRLTISKPGAIHNAEDVGIIIERGSFS